MYTCSVIHTCLYKQSQTCIHVRVDIGEISTALHPFTVRAGTRQGVQRYRIMFCPIWMFTEARVVLAHSQVHWVQWTCWTYQSRYLYRSAGIEGIPACCTCTWKDTQLCMLAYKMHVPSWLAICLWRWWLCAVHGFVNAPPVPLEMHLSWGTYLCL